MSIATNQQIKYSDLITFSVTYIQQKCENVFSSSSSSPLSVVDGYLNGSHPADWNSKDIGRSPGGTVRATMTVSDNIVTTLVTRTTVRTQLENFLKGRNLYVATDTEISHKSLINFVSNITAFACAKIVQVVNPFSTKKEGYLLYVPDNAVVVGVSDVSNLELTKNEIKDNVTSLTNVNSLTSNIHTINMNLAYNCSSSSSSCSSSSCSSSSSLFIAYMNLN